MNLLLLYGGKSVEHEISIRSAANVCDKLDKEKFKVFIVGIDKSGRWFWQEEVTSRISEGIPLSIDMSYEKAQLAKGESLVSIDVALPILHGTDGEDGSVQGLLKTCNIPFAGTGVKGSALCMDKVLSKVILEKAGVPVAKGEFYHEAEIEALKFEDFETEYGLPFMVKAAALGSSVGISKVNNRSEFETAVQEAFSYGSELIIEEYIEGRELECAILGNGDAKATKPGEIILLKDHGFYSYTAKYQDESGTDLQIPANVDENTADQIKSWSIKAYKALDCQDFARVDLFLTREGKIVVNEINTIPGFTNISMYPVLWEKEGIEYSALLSTIIDMALDRWKLTQNKKTSYEKA